jgi:hypothetical protein
MANVHTVNINPRVIGEATLKISNVKGCYSDGVVDVSFDAKIDSGAQRGLNIVALIAVAALLIVAVSVLKNKKTYPPSIETDDK